MVKVAQTIDHRRYRVLSQLFYLFMLKNPGNYQIKIPGQRMSRILNSLPDPDIDFSGRQRHTLPSKLPYAHLERNTRTQRRFLKYQAHSLILKIRRKLCFFQLLRFFKQLVYFFRTEIRNSQKISFNLHRKLLLMPYPKYLWRY